MEQINEKAVWERVTGGKQDEGPVGPVLLELMGRKQEDARSYRTLAGRMNTEQQRVLRLMASEVSQQVRLLQAIYFLLTGRRAEKPAGSNPVRDSGPEGLCRMLRREEGSRLTEAAGRCSGQTREALLAMAEQDARRFHRLLQVLGQVLE